MFAITNVIDATNGSVIRSNIKKNAIFRLQYGCIAIDKIIVDSKGEPRTVVVIPFDGTHKWNKFTITIANLCDVVNDIVSKYSTLDPSEFRSSKHGGALAMFESMGLVNAYKAAYAETKTDKRCADHIETDPTVREMYITVLNGRMSLLDKEHMRSLRAVCGGDLNVQKIVLNGSVPLSSLKLLSNS